MKYSLFCLLSIMILAQEAVELAPNEYDYYRIQLSPNQIENQDMYITLNFVFDSITMRCDSQSMIFGTVQNTNQITIYLKDRIYMGCSDSEFAIGLSYNTEIKTINLQVYGLDDYIRIADNYYDNARYKTPTVQLVENQFTIGYEDEKFEIKTYSKNIYVEMVSCERTWIHLDQVKADGTLRQIQSNDYDYRDSLNETSATYSVSQIYTSGLITPQFMIKYQSYSLDKTIPYDKIYSYGQQLSYSQDGDDLKFQVPGIYTSVSYSSIQYFIVLGKSSDREYIYCYSANFPQSNAPLTYYYYGNDNYNPEIIVYYPDQSHDYAVAFAKITINGVTITKQVGSTYFFFTTKTSNFFLPILISLIGIFVIIFAIIRYRMKLKQQQSTQQPLISPQANPAHQQVINQHSYVINQ